MPAVSANEILETKTGAAFLLSASLSFRPDGVN